MSQVHNLARKAEKDGVLVNPGICEDCKETGKKLVKHHDDYSKPLEVRWLCTKCHLKFHRENKNVRDPNGPEMRARQKNKRSTLADRVFKARLKVRF